VIHDRLNRIFLYDADKNGGGSGDDSDKDSSDGKEKAETKAITKEDLDQILTEHSKNINEKVERKTFTQEELDHLFAERTKNVKDKVQAEILRALGANSLDDIKAIITRQKDIDEAAKTDLQKAQEEAQTAKLEAEQAKAEQAKVMAAAREALMKADVLRHVVAFKDANGNTFRPEAVDDVWLILDKASITDEENGDFKGIKEAVEKVAKDRPHWLIDAKQVAKPRGTPDNQKSQKHDDDKKSTVMPSKRTFTL
jgi:hypothetical protein